MMRQQKVFNRWVEVVAEWSANRKAINRSLKLMSQRRVASCLRSWRENVAELVRDQELVRRAAVVFQKKSKCPRPPPCPAPVIFSVRNLLRDLCYFAYQMTLLTVLAAGFRGWAANAHRARAQRALASRVITRLRMASLTKSFDTWVEVLDTRKRNRVTVAKFTKLIQNRTLTRAFNGWMAKAVELKSQRVRVQRAVARFARGSVARAFERWLEHADERKRTRSLVRKLLGRYQNRSEAAAFLKWKQWKLDMQVLAESHSMKKRFELLRHRHLKSVSSAPKPIVIRLFHLWHKVVIFEKSHSRHVFHSTLRRRITTKRTVFLAWRDFAAERRRCTLMLRRHLLSAIRVRLLTALKRWTLAAHIARAEHAMVERRKSRQKAMVLRMLKSRLSRAFSGWQSAHFERRQRRQTLSRWVLARLTDT